MQQHDTDTVSLNLLERAKHMETGLADKHVVVTGASGAIGSETARQFAAEGANVTIHFHKNQAAANSVLKQCGANAATCSADLTNEADVRNLFEDAESRFGPIHVFVANAGVWPVEDQSIHEISLERWQRTLNANLTSTFLCMKYFFSRVQDHQIQDPAAVMISSTAGIFGEAGHSDYAAAKAAIAGGLLPSLKNELQRIASHGRINAVCPGWTLTPMTEKFADDGGARAKALQTIAMKKFATPSDIASTVVFLCSTNAGHITGQAITVSGGMEGRVLHDFNPEG